MQDRLEKLIRAVYKGWKKDKIQLPRDHPDEETLVCFLENRLSAQENIEIKSHLIGCETCAQSIALQLKLDLAETKEIPVELLERIKNLVVLPDKTSILEIFLRVKEKVLEIINTTGDILVGQEFVPAPVLRGRKIKDFRDEVTILKDFKDIRVEAKIESKGAGVFSLSIVVKEKATQKIMKDLRVTLIRDDLELESYISGTGKVTFENVLIGKYTVEISNPENKLAGILLDIKV